MVAVRRIGVAAALVLLAVGLWWAWRSGAGRRKATPPSTYSKEPGSAGDSLPPSPSQTSTVAAPPTAATSQAVASFDRPQRDRVRELIWRAFGEKPPAEPSVDARRTYALRAEPPHDPPGDAGHIEPEYIQQHVRSEFFGPAAQCYADAQQRLPDPRGQVVFWFTIVGDEKVGGIVESVDALEESTLRDPDMIECMRQSFLSVTFPPPKEGGYVTVKYPVAFAPDDDP
jgi:hypothetical protein